ncbi:MAG: FtsX-like permease family protein, partial [Pseudohongiellaceae bacterium]
SLPGDIQVASAAGSQQNIAPTLAAQIAQLPGVADVEGAVQKRVETRVGPLRLLAATMEGGEGFYIKQGEAAQLAAWSRGEGILVSEPLAYLQNLTPGGTLQIFTDRGPQEFPIVGIFYDYTSSLGLVGMHESLYEQWWNDTGLTRLSVTLEADAAGRDQVMVRLRELLASLGDYQAVANNEIRRITLTIFDRTFAITNVLRLLAIVVAFVGVLSALMALQLERLKEFAILRATGMTPAQVAGLILLQTAVMGLFAGLLALPLGLLMSDILINVINQRSFGWSMQQLLPLGVLAEGLILALVAALLAGLYPAFRAASIRPARALREE